MPGATGPPKRPEANPRRNPSRLHRNRQASAWTYDAPPSQGIPGCPSPIPQVHPCHRLLDQAAKAPAQARAGGKLLVAFGESAMLPAQVLDEPVQELVLRRRVRQLPGGKVRHPTLVVESVLSRSGGSGQTRAQFVRTILVGDPYFHDVASVDITRGGRHVDRPAPERAPETGGFQVSARPVSRTHVFRG